MTQLREIYKCEICGNVVEVLHTGKGVLVCCGEPMKKLVENTVEASAEKHIPVVEEHENGSIVKVGSVAHPMEAEHYIEWIEVFVEKHNKVLVQHLKPGDAPEAVFSAKPDCITEVRAYCNKHGLWSKK